jgi:plasmid maintenance system antidote protein VapI
MGRTGVISPNNLRAELARRNVRHYQLATALNVAPTKLSGLLHGRLAVSEAESLRERIEAHLGLAPGALADTTK